MVSNGAIHEYTYVVPSISGPVAMHPFYVHLYGRRFLLVSFRLLVPSGLPYLANPRLDSHEFSAQSDVLHIKEVVLNSSLSLDLVLLCELFLLL